MVQQYILSIDQGTTSCRAFVFAPDGKIIGVGQEEFSQHFPQPGWVEHDPLEILETQIKCIKTAVKSAGIKSEQIACVGLTNQRETTVVWNKETMRPVHRAIVWQCRRTTEIAEKLKSNHNELFKTKTGLIPDAYFSGPKIRWILDNVSEARAAAESAKLAFGTIDTWLIANLTAEKNHLTEPSNASRTMLFNLQTLSWDDQLLDLIGVPKSMMPQVVPSNANFGTTRKELFGFSAPIISILGDQQAALFGQCCFEPGQFKCTYGTGSFLLGNIGQNLNHVPGLLTTVAWQLENEKPIYALEGAVFIAGAAIQWLRDGLGLIATSTETENLANSLSSNEGVYFVPALVGLGSPWWNSDVRGAIFGLTRGTNRAHFARAALEAMAYQVKDLIEETAKSGLKTLELRVDGGATNNQFLLQFQADLLNVSVKRAAEVEATAWGVAALAALKAGLLSKEQLHKSWQCGLEVKPKQKRDEDYNGWKSALQGVFAAASGAPRK